jgi:hypothetical protein
MFRRPNPYRAGDAVTLFVEKPDYGNGKNLIMEKL